MMSNAIELIVDGYVSQKDRTALSELKAHRERLLADLKGKTGGAFDVSKSIRQIEDEIVVIDGGLARLDAVSS